VLHNRVRRFLSFNPRAPRGARLSLFNSNRNNEICHPFREYCFLQAGFDF
jgi:hypothetical protein